MSPKGVHYIVEVSGCDDTITNVPKLQDILVEAANRAHAQVWSVSFNKFPPNGVSGVVVISESHLSVHTWPEVNYMALDIYTCGAHTEPMLAVYYVLEKVKSSHIQITEITRGLDDNDENFYHSFITWEENRVDGLKKDN
ncbi:MAG: adenosylmethionine decarboxylase [Synergistaceae bacterium]|nr:adenosylmethionine decarboxylase [Synergistaceae bacterium]